MGLTAKGQPHGVATLDGSGHLPSGQLPGGVSYALAPLTATATLDFPSTASGAVSVLTVAVTGAAVGSKVALGAPSTLEAGLVAFGFVSAAGTVSIRLANLSGATVDPVSASWNVAVFTT